MWPLAMFTNMYNFSNTGIYMFMHQIFKNVPLPKKVVCPCKDLTDYLLLCVSCLNTETLAFSSLLRRSAIFNAVCRCLSVNHHPRADPSRNLWVWFTFRTQTSVLSWTPPRISVIGLKPKAWGRSCNKDGWVGGSLRPSLSLRYSPLHRNDWGHPALRAENRQAIRGWAWFPPLTPGEDFKR